MRIKRFVFISLFLAFCIICNAATASLCVGQSYQKEIDATGYKYITIESISSTNPSVSVTKMGLVAQATIKAYFPGESTITVKLRYQLYNGQNYQYRTETFTLSCIDTNISLSDSKLNLKKGETKQLSYSFNRNTYKTPNVYWSSSDDNVARVSNDGKITAVAEGNAVVYAKSDLGSNQATCSVTVGNDGTTPDIPVDEGSISTSWYDSSKSEFRISTPDEMRGLRKLVNQGTSFDGKRIILDKDIDLSAYNWTSSIGSDTDHPFKGNIDGQNHTIKIKVDLTAEDKNYCYHGLFGYTRGGSIKNIQLTGNIYVKIAQHGSYPVYVGTIVGCTGPNTKVSYCINKASLSCDRIYYTQQTFVGGIVGNADYGSVTYCVNRGSVRMKGVMSTSSINRYYVGGICGYGFTTYSRNYATIECEKAAEGITTSVDNTWCYVGGIVGMGSASYSCNLGSVYGHAGSVIEVGGIAGSIVSSMEYNYVSCNSIGDTYSATGSSPSYYINYLYGGKENGASAGHCYTANDITIYKKKNGDAGNQDYDSNLMKTESFAEVLNSSNCKWVGHDGLFPIQVNSCEEEQYYYTDITNITATSATLSSNAKVFLNSDYKSGGFLLKLDDGKESFISCEPNKTSIEIEKLLPNRNYAVRWYAQDNNGKEYYGVLCSFKTSTYEPKMIKADEIKVTSFVLYGQSNVKEYTKRGFHITDSESMEDFVVWNNDNEGHDYSLPIEGLSGGKKYQCTAIISITENGNEIYYEGDMVEVSTANISTLAANGFTESSAIINGEVSNVVSNISFEYRDLSWPSVIEANSVDATVKDGKATAVIDALQIGNTYKYRIIGYIENEKVEGEWVEFSFDGPDAIFFTKEDMNSFVISGNTIRSCNNKPFEIYSLDGKLIEKATITCLNKGSYIVKKGDRTIKIAITK